MRCVEGRRRVIGRLEAFRDLPYPHTSEHLIGDAGAWRVALGPRADPPARDTARRIAREIYGNVLSKDSWPPIAGIIAKMVENTGHRPRGR